MALTGDFSRLQQLRMRLATAGKEFVAQARTRMATAVHGEVLNEFMTSTNPNGRLWAPRKDRRGQWPLLMKSRRNGLVDSVRAIAVTKGIKITMKPYGKFLNDGTRNMVARRLVPMNGELPTRWANALMSACDAAADAVMR